MLTTVARWPVMGHSIRELGKCCNFLHTDVYFVICGDKNEQPLHEQGKIPTEKKSFTPSIQ